MKKSKDIIIKHNDLVQSSYSLSLLQQKIILYVISKLDQNMMIENDLFYVDVTFKDLKEIIAVNISKEKLVKFTNHYYIIRTLKNLKERTLIIKTKEQTLYTGWIIRFIHLKGNQTIRIYLDPYLKDYLLNLNRFFTYYKLENVIRFKNKNTFRIYELLKQYVFLNKRVISIDDIKYYLGLTNKYKLFPLFRKKVIDITINEINKYSDIRVKYKVLRNGKTPVSIEFKIKQQKINKLSQEINPYLLTKLKSLLLNTNQINEILSQIDQIDINLDDIINEINFIKGRIKRIHNLQSYSYKVLMDYILEKKDAEDNRNKMDLSLNLKAGDTIIYQNRSYIIESDIKPIVLLTEEGAFTENMIINYIKKGDIIHIPKHNLKE